MDESRFRIGYYYSKKEGTIALTLDDLHKVLNTGHGYHKITKARHHKFVTVAGNRSRLNANGVLVFVPEAGELLIKPMNFATAPRLVDIGAPGLRATRVPKTVETDAPGRRKWVYLDEEAIKRGRAFAAGPRKKRPRGAFRGRGIEHTWHPVPTPNVSKNEIATDERPLILPYEWETITTPKGVKKDDETITIALDDLQQILNAGYGYHEITPSRSSGSVSIIRRKTAQSG